MPDRDPDARNTSQPSDPGGQPGVTREEFLRALERVTKPLQPGGPAEADEDETARQPPAER